MNSTNTIDNNNNNNNNNGFDQNVIVMRHGDRMDNFVVDWASTVVSRKWDPPLFETGFTRAFNVGKEFRTQLHFPIHRVFVSPFLRCLQTALEVINGLSSSQTDASSLSFDPSNLKVSIEYGLCEMLSRVAIRPDLAPEDGKFDFNISELEAMLPAGTVDHSVERIYSEMPRWEETILGARSRYEQVIQGLANKYPKENLLLVTHGEGVGVSVSTFKKHAVAYEVNYCAYSHAKRHITFQESESFNATCFQLLTAHDIRYRVDNLADGV